MEATYRPVFNDKAPFTCKSCGKQRPFNEVWYITTPNFYKGVHCKPEFSDLECIDKDWLKKATFIEKPI